MEKFPSAVFCFLLSPHQSKFDSTSHLIPRILCLRKLTPSFLVRLWNCCQFNGKIRSIQTLRGLQEIPHLLYLRVKPTTQNTDEFERNLDRKKVIGEKKNFSAEFLPRIFTTLRQ